MTYIICSTNDANIRQVLLECSQGGGEGMGPDPWGHLALSGDVLHCVTGFAPGIHLTNKCC